MVRPSGVGLSISATLEFGLQAMAALAVWTASDGDSIGAAAKLVGVAFATFELGACSFGVPAMKYDAKDAINIINYYILKIERC